MLRVGKTAACRGAIDLGGEAGVEAAGGERGRGGRDHGEGDEAGEGEDGSGMLVHGGLLGVGMPTSDHTIRANRETAGKDEDVHPPV
jgi:hypothetical protein